MRKFLPSITVGITIVLAIAAVILYLGRLRPLLQESEGTPIPDITEELFVSISNPQRRKVFIQTATLNKLILEDFSLDVVDVDGEKKPVLSLVVAFKSEGRNLRLTIPVVDSVLYRDYGQVGPEVPEEGTFVNVASLNLERGRLINVTLGYIPTENPVTIEDLLIFCEQIGNKACPAYIALGFGKGPIDFNSYFRNLFTNNDEAAIDYNFAFPTYITIPKQ